MLVKECKRYKSYVKQKVIKQSTSVTVLSGHTYMYMVKKDRLQLELHSKAFNFVPMLLLLRCFKPTKYMYRVSELHSHMSKTLV